MTFLKRVLYIHISFLGELGTVFPNTGIIIKQLWIYAISYWINLLFCMKQFGTCSFNSVMQPTYRKRACHRSGCLSQASHIGGLGSTTGQVMWDLWCTKWHWGRFSQSTSVSAANSHSTNCSKNHPHLSSGAGTIGQTVAAVPSGLSLTPWEKKMEHTGYSNFLHSFDQLDLCNSRNVFNVLTICCARSCPQRGTRSAVISKLMSQFIRNLVGWGGGFQVKHVWFTYTWPNVYLLVTKSLGCSKR
jgi:hypothetical protein